MKTVLIVDDNAELHFLAGLILHNKAVKAVHAYTVEEAVTALQEQGIDVVSLDFQLAQGTTEPLAEVLALSTAKPRTVTVHSMHVRAYDLRPILEKNPLITVKYAMVNDAEWLATMEQ